MRDLKQGVTISMYRYICEREQRHYQQCVMWAYECGRVSLCASTRESESDPLPALSEGSPDRDLRCGRGIGRRLSRAADTHAPHRAPQADAQAAQASHAHTATA